MPSMKAVHFGGGNIGRGFVAEKLNLAGYEIVFLDVVDVLVKQLQTTKSYTVTEIGAEGSKATTISNYRAIHSGKAETEAIKEIVDADIVTCAVGAKILKFIAPLIAKGIDARKTSTPLVVIACENMVGATDQLAEYIKSPKNTPADRLKSISDRARFANSAIDRIVPLQDPDAGLNVKIESFYEWVVDRTPFKSHGPPNIDAILWVDDLEPYIERKLYTVNTGHAAAAYYGHVRGKTMVHDALADKEIHDIVRECLAETSNLIVNKHGIGVEDQQEYVNKIMKRISNPALEDVVERVARNPIRKLGRKERFIGPAYQLSEQGNSYTALLGAAEQALRFTDVEDDDESAELSKMLQQVDAESIVGTVCGLEKSDKIFGEVVEIVKRVQREKHSKVGMNGVH